MLFVQHPEEFGRVMPGFLPLKLRPAGFGTGSFDRSLGEALFPGGSPPLAVADHPACDRRGFWSSWYLASHASVSQYDTLRQVIGDRPDLPGHVVCLALSGSGFHGQQSRAWAAVTGNLHLSVAFRCDLDAADSGLALTMLPAVAVVDVLESLATPETPLVGLGIKWVNDILVDGRKIGGVLTSARSLEGRIGSCVLGIGLNVASVPEVPPTPFTPGVTCLKEHVTLPGNGLETILGSVLQALAGRFEELEEQGSGPMLDAYRSASLVLGRQVEIRPDEHSSGPIREGRVLAIGPNLSLTLTDGPEPVTTGRLVLMPETA